MGRGTKEVEGLIARQENLRHESFVNVTREEAEKMVERERDMVLKAMENEIKGLERGGNYTNLKGD